MTEKTKLQQFCIDILPIIQAGAKGARIGLVTDDGSDKFVELPANDLDDCTFTGQNKYKIIRKKISVNGFSVLAGEEFKPARNAICYVPDLTSGNYFASFIWVDDNSNHDRVFGMGLVYLNSDEAVARARAMLNINPALPEPASVSAFEIA